MAGRLSHALRRLSPSRVHNCSSRLQPTRSVLTLAGLKKHLRWREGEAYKDRVCLVNATVATEQVGRKSDWWFVMALVTSKGTAKIFRKKRIDEDELLRQSV
eukprot:5163141-Amphidinium_carterae.2